MRAAEHLALCEAKRGGSTGARAALCEELEVRESSNARLLGTLDIEIHRGMEYKDRAEAAEARCKEMAKVVERYRACGEAAHSRGAGTESVRRPAMIERFMSHVTKTTGCWEWIWVQDVVWLWPVQFSQQETTRAHRIAYEARVY